METPRTDDQQELPYDAVLEVLTRAPLRTLGRCKLVSKDWNRMSYESSFMKLHSQRTKTVSGYFVQTLERGYQYSSTFVSCGGGGGDGLSLDFVSSNVEIAASAKRELMLCLNWETRIKRIPRYCVCKSGTKQWEKIPNPKTRFHTLHAAIILLSSCPLHYKIFRFSQPERRSLVYNNMQCEIFDSTTWAWNRKNDIELPYDVSLKHAPPVLARGTIHWPAYHGDCVFAFDGYDESWTILPLPLHLQSKNRSQLVEYKGMLALVMQRNTRGEEDRIELWVLENYKRREWRKRQSLCLDGEEIKSLDDHVCFKAFCGEFALLGGYKKFIRYNFENCKVVDVRPIPMHYGEVFEFCSDVLS